MQPVRCHDPEVLDKFLDPYDYHMATSNKDWLETPGNVAYMIGDNLGLATLDYPGLFAVHWFFTSKGREAVEVCLAMLEPVFGEHGAKAIRGVVPIDNKPSRRLAKYVGCETFATETYPDGETYELMILSKERYNQFKERYNGS